MLLQLDDLERTYGGRGGVSDVSLAVPRGAIYLLCGPNGAGKTTTLSVLAGLLFAGRGRLRLDGVEIPLDRPARRPGLGFVPDDPFLDERLTPRQWAAFTAGMKGLRHWPTDAERLAGALRLDAATLAQRIETLSFGNKRKVALWVEMLTTTGVLLMDEPTIGLDPPSLDAFQEAARAFVAEGRAIVLSTHLLRDGEAIATHVGMIAAGRTRLEGCLREVTGDGDLTAAFRTAIEA